MSELERSKTVLLAGSTGLVGGFVLDLLLQEPSIEQVVNLVRRPSGQQDDRLDERQIDFEHLAEEPLGDLDEVYCCLGTTIKRAGSQEAFRRVDHDYVLALGRRGLEAGAKRFFLISSVGASPESKVFYSRVKGETEAAISALGFEELHIFQPSLLIGDRQEFRFGERLGIGLSLALDPILSWIPPFAAYRGIPARTVAAGMVGAGRVGKPGRHVHTFKKIVRLAQALGAPD